MSVVCIVDTSRTTANDLWLWAGLANELWLEISGVHRRHESHHSQRLVVVGRPGQRFVTRVVVCIVDTSRTTATDLCCGPAWPTICGSLLVLPDICGSRSLMSCGSVAVGPTICGSVAAGPTICVSVNPGRTFAAVCYRLRRRHVANGGEPWQSTSTRPNDLWRCK
jgi:hypothetical protein